MARHQKPRTYEDLIATTTSMLVELYRQPPETNIGEQLSYLVDPFDDKKVLGCVYNTLKEEPFKHEIWLAAKAYIRGRREGSASQSLEPNRETMSRSTKTLDKVLRGSSDKNLSFTELRTLLLHLGFVERIRGSHHIFSLEGLDEIVNLQPKNGRAKPYQVRQVRELIVSYGLATESGDASDGEPEEEANG